MSEPLQRRLVMLFCLHTNGDMPGATEDEIMCALRIKRAELLKTFSIFFEKNFINEHWELINWKKRQFSADSAAKRTRRWREKNAKAECDVTVTKCDVVDTDTDTEEKIYMSSEEQKTPPCPHQEIVSLYHKSLPELPIVKIWTKERSKLLKSRWVEDKGRQSLEWWKEYFELVRKQVFLFGMNGGWKADLEWLVRPSNMAKVLEGKYLSGPLKSKTPKEEPWLPDVSGVYPDEKF